MNIEHLPKEGHSIKAIRARPAVVINTGLVAFDHLSVFKSL